MVSIEAVSMLQVLLMFFFFVLFYQFYPEVMNLCKWPMCVTLFVHIININECWMENYEINFDREAMTKICAFLEGASMKLINCLAVIYAIDLV